MNEPNNQTANQGANPALCSSDWLASVLKEAEYALREALRTNKVGWLQEEAHRTLTCELARIQSRHE